MGETVTWSYSTKTANWLYQVHLQLPYGWTMNADQKIGEVVEVVMAVVLGGGLTWILTQGFASGPFLWILVFGGSCLSYWADNRK
jgi:hypothetical protein